MRNSILFISIYYIMYVRPISHMYERYVHLEFGDFKSNGKNYQKKFVNIKKI